MGSYWRKGPNLLEETPNAPIVGNGGAWLLAGSMAAHLTYHWVYPPIFICTIDCTSMHVYKPYTDMPGRRQHPRPRYPAVKVGLSIDCLRLHCLCLRGSRGKCSSMCFSSEPGCSSLSQWVQLLSVPREQRCPLRQANLQAQRQRGPFLSH